MAPFGGSARNPMIRSNWTMQEVAKLKDEQNPEKAQKKLGTINEGGEVAQENPVFPEDREFNDCCWAVLFFAFVIGMLGLCMYYGRNLDSFGEYETALQSTATPAPAWQQPGQFGMAPATPAASPDPYVFTKHVKPLYLVLGTLAGCIVSLFAATFLTFLSKCCGKCVVYTSLLFSACVMIIMGIVIISVGASGYGLPPQMNFVFYALGALMIMGGFCFGCCVMCCWHKMIEFTAEVVTQCGEITVDNCGMIIVAVLGAFFSAVWSIVVAIALDGVVATYDDDIATCKYCGYAIFGLFFFAWIWGCMVASSVCYTTFSGVFGKWYYSDDPDHGHNYDAPICSSFCDATTHSLGSICFGTFLVASVRAAEFVTRMAQQDAQQEGNIVCCLILCCVRCVLDCIGDIIEYFNEWAYVQCAIRGTCFCDSAKIVFSLCTVRNIYLIWATLLIDSVVNFGSFLGGVCAAGIGAGIGYLGSAETALLGALTGLVAGNAVGWCVMSTFSAGSKTLLTCWAENPETMLGKSHEADNLYNMFREKGGLSGW